MNPKLEAILKDIENVRIFTDGSYLTTSYFVIFLLFGSNGEQRAVLQAKANKLIAENQAFALIDVQTSYEPEAVTRQVQEVIEKASEWQIAVKNLYEIHICPVVFSECFDPLQFNGAISAVEDYLNKRDILTMWKMFLLLDTLSEDSGAWLKAVSDSVAELHKKMHSCRCCLLTRKNEKGFGVAEERLLITVLFVAFLHVVNEVKEDIGRHIGVDTSAPEALFYTAQTVFVENPVATRILGRMSGLLERLCKEQPKAKDIDMGFMDEILLNGYKRMPHEGELVSLLPLYSVMPGEIEDFKRRLKKFANLHYLNFAKNEKEKQEVFRQIASGFLIAFMKTGKGIDDLVALQGNTEEIKKITDRPLQVVTIEDLPSYPVQSRYSREVLDVYENAARWLTKELTGFGKKLMRDFFESAEFSNLPEQYRYVQGKLEEEISEMKRIKQKRLKLDVTLRLLNDPDKKWLDDEFNSNKTPEVYIEYFRSMVLAKSDAEFDAELSGFLEKLYEISKSLSGGSGAKSYMKLLSDTCADLDGDGAKSCVTEIGGALNFPVRVSENISDKESHTYVWGSDDNNIYHAWKEYHTIINTKSTLLPLKSDERFVVLRVSAPFSRDSVLSIDGGDVQ